MTIICNVPVPLDQELRMRAERLKSVQDDYVPGFIRFSEFHPVVHLTVRENQNWSVCGRRIPSSRVEAGDGYHMCSQCDYWLFCRYPGGWRRQPGA